MQKTLIASEAQQTITDSARSPAPDLLAHLPYGLLTLARDAHITYANTAAEDALGEGLAYLKKRKLSDVFHPSEKLLALVNTAFTEGAPIKEYDFTLSGHRAGIRIVTLHLVPFGDELLMCFDDVSAAQTLSHSVMHRMNARSQSNMGAILAHEVKNPLAGIRGAAQLLQKTVKPEDLELTALICMETDRIRSVVEEMEFFSNPSELKMESVNVHEVLRYAKNLSSNASAGHVTFIEHFDPSIPLVPANKNLLIQAFINLMKNAVEATDKETVITLTTAYQSKARLSMGNHLNPKPLPIHITVEDTGPGIAPELRDTLFDPFVTTKKTGKGLGLAIVAKIIADHGGIIELDSLSEQGTRFTILLPMA